MALIEWMIISNNEKVYWPILAISNIHDNRALCVSHLIIILLHCSLAQRTNYHMGVFPPYFICKFTKLHKYCETKNFLIELLNSLFIYFRADIEDEKHSTNTK